MESLKLTNYTLNDFLLFGDYILEHGRLQGKSGHDMKIRFIEGLPAFFDAEKTHMRQNQTLVYPALYGGMAEFRRTHLAGVAHPMAGQPSIELLVAAYTSDWMEKSESTRGRGNPLIKGYVRQIELSQDTGVLTLTGGELICPPVETSMTANMATKNVTKDTMCHLCGGHGHAITQYTEEGEKITCATKVLEDLNKDPSVDHSKRASKYKARAQSLEATVHDLREQLEQTQEQLNQVTQSRIHAHAASSSHRGDEESCSESTDLEDIDATSEGSDFGPQQFAEQVQKGKFTKFKPRYIPRKGTRK